MKGSRYSDSQILTIHAVSASTYGLGASRQRILSGSGCSFAYPSI